MSSICCTVLLGTKPSTTSTSNTIARTTTSDYIRVLIFVVSLIAVVLVLALQECHSGGPYRSTGLGTCNVHADAHVMYTYILYVNTVYT